MIDMNKKQFKRLLALAALIAFGCFLLFVLHNFITPFLGAVIFSIMFKKLMNYLVNVRRWHNSWSAILIIILSFFIILIPIFTLSFMLYSKISVVVNEPTSLLNIIHLADSKIQNTFGVDVFNDELIHNIKSKASNLIPSLLNQITWILGNIVMMYFMLYYLLVERELISLEANKVLPFDANNITVLTNELESMTLSNAIGVPLIAIIQGTAAGLGYWFFGLADPFFWGVITAFVSLLPIVGSTLIWLPAGLFILAMGNTWSGVGMLIYGAVVIINIDNVARFTIQKKFADVHPLITVFGVLIGLNLFGLPGLIFGPLMLSYFVIFTRMYRRVYKQES